MYSVIAVILWHCLSLGLEWKLTFPSLVATTEFSKFDDFDCSTFTGSSFGIWNSSTGIPSPPLALFVVMLPKAHLTSHSRMSHSMWVWMITPSWLSGLWRSFLYSSVYSWHIFLISSASLQFSSVQLLSRVQLFAISWISACQASLSITISQRPLKLTSIELVMPSSHLILSCLLFLLPPIPPSIRVFSNESTLRMRLPKYWSFSFSIIPSKEHPGLISFRMDWLDLVVQGTLKSLLQHHRSKASILLLLLGQSYYCIIN